MNNIRDSVNQARINTAINKIQISFKTILI